MSRVLMFATARPTFAVDVATTLAASARDLLVDLGADVLGPKGLLLTGEDVEEAARHLDEQVDLVVHVCASFADAGPALQLYAGLERPVLLWSFREPGPVGDRLWLNSLCGANLYGHALVRSGGEVRLLYGDPEESQVRDALGRALRGELPIAPALPTTRRLRGDEDRARQALASLQGARVGVVGEPPPGFTPSEFDPKLLAGLFGLTVEPLTIDDLFGRIDTVDATERDRELASVTTSRPSLTGLDEEEVRRHAAVTSSLRGWTSQASLSAVAVRCWPEFPTRLGVCPCSSLSRLADEGTPTVCERDVYGAVTMLLLEALGSGTSYLVDTVELDAERNVVRFWHCGSAATSLAADPAAAEQSVHCNRKIGVAGNFALRPGPVLMARLTEDPESAGAGLRLLIAAGESLPALNRFQGNTAEVRLENDAETFVHSLVTGGFPHHTVLAWTDIRPQLRSAADLLGVPVIEW